MPNDDAALREDEEPLESDPLGHSLAPEPEEEPSEDAGEEPEPPATRYDRRR